jgi:phosphoribosylformimino-5-aminoimidazole carboxamide ribonucleotide (ProFAR) isomerase
MSFEVIPAIDVAGGRLARYTPQGPEPMDAFGGDPMAAARSYAATGARWAHVVDLDLAFEGEARNLAAVRAVADSGLRVQASGGLRRIADAEAMLAAGAHRVVLGSAGLDDEAATLEMLRRLGERVVVGVEVDGGRIRSRGGLRVDLPLAETLGWLVAAGAPALLVTAVPRVGTLGGPDAATVRRVVRAGRPVLAAGGISSVADLRVLLRAGAVGAVVGRAALEGGLDLQQALALA